LKLYHKSASSSVGRVALIPTEICILYKIEKTKKWDLSNLKYVVADSRGGHTPTYGRLCTIKKYVNLDELQGKITSYKSLFIEWCQKMRYPFEYQSFEIRRARVALSTPFGKVGFIVHFVEGEKQRVVFSMERTRFENALIVVEE